MAEITNTNINNQEQEIWVPVPDEPYNRTFMISNWGQIKNNNTGKIKTLSLNNSTGYYQVRLDMGKKYKKITYQIHQLVATIFIGPCPEGKIVNHKDLNKINNKVSNLEYLTLAENRQHYLQNRKEKISDLKERKKITKEMEELEKFELKGFSKYLIDKQGNIYTKTSGKIKVPYGFENGYDKQSLIPDVLPEGKVNVKRFVHRLVADTFIPNPHNLPFVNHKNANKKDNSVENLEWCTAEQNMEHDAKLRKTGKCVQAYDKEGKLVKEYGSIKAAGKDLNINSTTITKVISGVYKQAGGYTWKLKENKEEIKPSTESIKEDIKEDINDTKEST